jgi:antitoxin ChpS
MYSTTLRRVGGSVMLSIPPALLDMLHMTPGSEVALRVEGGGLRISAKYTTAELLARSDYSQDRPDREWIDAPPVGGELL